ncbi:hypothetical protein ZOSMA_57G00470 [Zostera marina]|uniref:Anamorsin homolog n=1 Tax=Zostera marina TaxID=29655 RepID=A0A0K9NVD6_ZOSMR|nr:hypothetical protein ZOSMA_57G00470 [Zostera marina]
MSGSALLISNHAMLPINTTLSAFSDIATLMENENNFLVVTQASLLEKLPIETATLDIVVSILKSYVSSEEGLEEYIRVLKPGGILLIQTPLPSNEDTNTPSSQLERKLLLSGLLDVKSVDVKPIFPKEDIKIVTVKAKKASWVVGSSFSIKKTVTSNLPKIEIDDDLDLIDEDTLLTEEDLKHPQLPLVGDCEVSTTRKACKNCSCGRAEAEEKSEKSPKLGLTEEQLNNPQSECGSCGLGDAFRCNTCPYKGLPPFKPGEKVSLGNFLVADI